MNWNRVGIAWIVCMAMAAQESGTDARTKLLAAYPFVVRQAENGDVHQQLFLNAKLHEIGQAPMFEYSTIVRRLDERVKTGDATAIYWSAVFAANDHPGFKKDLIRSKALIIEAAKLGHPNAMLDFAYELSRDKSQSEQAVDWWLKARETLTKQAESGDTEAMYRLWYLHPPAGVMYHPRLVGIALSKEGTKWQRRGADAGDIEAMFSLGCRLADQKDLDKACERAIQLEGMEWLTKSAEKGHWEAMARLGMIYVGGLTHQLDQGTFKSDLRKAWYWWDRAIAIVGEEKVAEVVLLPGESWPPRPGSESRPRPSSDMKKRPKTAGHREQSTPDLPTKKKKKAAGSELENP